jgi:Ca2+/Na+ antiporter
LSYNKTGSGLFEGKDIMISPLEIVLIIVVVLLIAFVARLVRTGCGAAGPKPAADQDTAACPPRNNRTASYLNRSGITLVIIGIIALIAAASLFRWVLQGYLWAFILIALGVMMVVLSRKKR